ncbi:MAG TPA: SDR family NAD(P)-dependent oxidoreductase [Thermoleophilaceae bacterium]|nr:SDR family NAD(P)-dependent oxidoreductase [Thermoleophilaceae bacterium]
MPHRLVLVTGAGGFIGSHVVEGLVEAGDHVRAFVRYTSRGDRGWLDDLAPAVRDAVDVVAGDLRDPESVAGAAAGVDAVIHLGAQIAIPYSYLNPRDFVATNVTGTLNVLQAARAADLERVVHVSTSEVYGTPDEVPITEAHPLRPQSPYAASKVAADMLVHSFACSYGLRTAIVRPFNTFGPRQSQRAIVPTIVAQALAGEEVALGALDPRRDLTFVTDTAAGIVAVGLADAAVGRTVQLGTGGDVSVRELAMLAGEIVGRQLSIVHDPARIRPVESEIPQLLADNGLARTLTGWSPRVPLREGLERTIEWIERNMPPRAAEYAR